MHQQYTTRNLRIMTNDLDFNGLDDTTINAERGDDGFPRIQWVYGTKPTQGGFWYTSAATWDGDLPEPWRAVQWYGEEDGWAADVLKVMPILRRSQPFRNVIGTDGRKRREYAERWESGMQVHTELLCLAEGVDGPVVLTFKGMAGVAIDGKDGAMKQAKKILADEATKTAKNGQKIGLGAFWVPLGARLNSKGKPEFVETVGGSWVSVPALRLPDLTGRALLVACYDKEHANIAAALRREHVAWADERRTNAPEEAKAPETPRRNVPQSIEADEDIGF